MGAIALEPAPAPPSPLIAGYPRRITLVVTALLYGGAEQQVTAIGMELSRRGWSVQVVPMLPPLAHVEELTAAGATVDSLGMPRSIPDPRAIARLASTLRRRRPSIVHSHMVHANLLARLTRPLVRVPVLISTAHNVQEKWGPRPYRLTDRLADLTTNVSRAAVDRYIEIGAVPRHKIRYVPNGIDLSRFRPDRRARERMRAELGLGSRPTWLAVGRMHTQKNHASMLEAFAGTLRHYPESVLLLVGGGPLETELRAHARALGLAECVRFLGRRADVPDIMNAADAYVMSSSWEGLPIVLLEAGAVGLPIVATDVGGNAEIVLDGENGYLVPPEDPEALREAMERMLAVPEDARHQAGARGRAHVLATFGIERVVDEWERIYEELLARREPSRSPRSG